MSHTFLGTIHPTLGTIILLHLAFLPLPSAIWSHRQGGIKGVKSWGETAFPQKLMELRHHWLDYLLRCAALSCLHELMSRFCLFENDRKGPWVCGKSSFCWDLNLNLALVSGPRCPPNQSSCVSVQPSFSLISVSYPLILVSYSWLLLVG